MMDARRWKRIQDLYHQASELDIARRKTLLDRQCADDADLRAEIESLLVASEGATEFFDQDQPHPEPDPREPAGDDSALGRVLGPYRLIRRLGEGGMGQVFLAARIDGEFEQQVAIKLMRSPWIGPELLQRFLAERQILARLEHPGIARLIDGGSTALGQPYLVMDHVDGLPIDRYCQQHQHSIRERLGLFVKVCQAVEHAHTRLVVHRDIKPSNILVSADGAPRLLDFGIARLLDSKPGEPALTRIPGQVLTPEYASPEQVRGEPITTASDVYSLGVMLYQLLTGQLPYKVTDTSRQQLEKLVCTTLPTRPSQCSTFGGAIIGDNWSRDLRGDLDTIVMRALAKAPDRRYPSVAALAEDIDRYLDCRPILARPASRTYILGRFLRRHRAAASIATIALIAILAGIVMATWGMVTAQAERDRAEQAALRAEQTTDFVTRMLSSIDPDRARGADTTLLKELLADAATRAPRELEQQPAVLGEIRRVIGITYLQIGEFDRALEHLSAAAQLADADSDRNLSLRSRLDLARHAAYTRNPAVGLEQVETLLDDTAHLPGADPLRISALGMQAQFLLDSGQPEAAALAVQQVLNHTEDLPDPALVSERIAAHMMQAQIHMMSGQFEQSHVHLERARSRAEDWTDPGAERYRRMALSSLALNHLMQGNHAEGIPLLRRSIAMIEAGYGSEHPMLVVEVNNLANALQSSGELEAARAPFKRALTLARQIHGIDSLMALRIQSNHAELLRQLGEPQAAALSHREVIDLAQQSLANSHPLQGRFRVRLGLAELELGNTQAAVEQLSDALDRLTSHLGPEHPDTISARQALTSARLGLN